VIFLSNAVSITGVLLEAICIVLLLRGSYRTYPFLLLSCLVMFFGAIVLGISLRMTGVSSASYGHVYWTVDVVDYFARFLFVVSLI